MPGVVFFLPGAGVFVKKNKKNDKNISGARKSRTCSYKLVFAGELDSSFLHEERAQYSNNAHPVSVQMQTQTT